MELTNIEKKHYLYPSTLMVCEEMHLVTTVLGSCISVCLYDNKIRVGGINHFMLPFWNGQGLASPKFGNIAMTQLIDKMTNLGSDKRNLVAKMFGGANQSNSRMNIGERNAKVAMEFLSKYGISIVAESIEGTVGRKIEFNSYTGEVRMKYIKAADIKF